MAPKDYPPIHQIAPDSTEPRANGKVVIITGKHPLAHLHGWMSRRLDILAVCIFF